ncbi:hypothetical protein HYN59_00805 [Flavobacterium album]|uniref:Uncharacterized protein n=1 Tax=Flavobacterium album TaxID=2175091 RepID=A0A2S1QTK7_9FLAO|nr:hypothetical protein [Flavobacterium album]AWH83742.1 hypothetical protein HYN59_00805 [Flavobacterium album]
MKKLLPICFLFVAICCRAQDVQRQNATYTPLETIITDLNADTVNDTIRLYETPVAGDPGKFRKMNVSVNGRRMTFFAKDAWDVIDDSFAKENNNAVKSKFAFVYKEAGQSFITLFGYPYPASREEVFILRIKDRNMEVIFHNKIEEPLKMADINNDGSAELITQATPVFSNTTANGLTGSYSPYLVYSLSPVFGIDKTLTEKYNREYYVWAGMRYSDAIRVFYPNDGSKPKLIKTN